MSFHTFVFHLTISSEEELHRSSAPAPALAGYPCRIVGRIYFHTQVVELSKYLSEPLIQRKYDPVLWWKANAFRFPGLAEVAQIYT
jgi:hAT family C-terminal dimerisation region